jgi:hypothetical protein
MKPTFIVSAKEWVGAIYKGFSSRKGTRGLEY